MLLARHGSAMTEHAGGGRPPASLLAQLSAVCANCRKPIRRHAAGADWYHRHNASASCYPGRGSWKRATPREVED
jgi:hypothetical protein